MNVLELFSGTHSVGKICDSLGWSSTSLDLQDADININILDWDYKEYPPNHFDIIWASPPCQFFSKCRDTHIGRPLKRHGMKILTKQMLLDDIYKYGLPILRKTEEIIEYFKPKYYFIENPQTGKMKDYIDKPYYDVDYCKYSDWGYKKRTRIWTNLEGFDPKLCCNDCDNLIPNTKLHKQGLGGGRVIIDNGKILRLKSREDRKKYRHNKDIRNYQGKCETTLKERYRIPPKSIEELFILTI